MLTLAKEASERFAHEEDIDVAWSRIWSIEPILFDEQLVELADEAIREVSGTSHRLPSGPLARRCRGRACRRPTVMVFVQSLRGLSHTKLEDTKEEHLELAVAGARSTGNEDDGGIRMSDDNLFGDEHVRRYVETDGEVGYIWREGAPILLLTITGRKSGKEYYDAAHLRSRRRELGARRVAGRRT